MMIPSDPGWRAALHIIERLVAAGHRAVLAGGCVRDMLLDLQPKDYDVATDARPERVRELFPGARHVGAKFGVILVRKLERDVEVATFRTEGPYSDGRHPDTVAYGTEEQDAKRRDFTINGLFFDPATGQVIDYVGGGADLSRRVVRTIGRPAHRFTEDHLRMLRGVRLAAKLGFAIDAETENAIRETAARLRSISAERIWAEVEQILVDPARAVGWQRLVDLGLREHLSPLLPETQDVSLVHRRLTSLPELPVSAELGFAALVCDLSPQQASRICQSLRMSNRLTGRVAWLVSSLRRVREGGELELADLKLMIAEPAWPDLLELLRADLMAHGRRLDVYDLLKSRAAGVAPADVAPPPLLTGEDLIQMGFSPGPKFGEVLTELYRRQLNGALRTHDQAANLAKQLLLG